MIGDELSGTLKRILDACVQFNETMAYVPMPAGKWFENAVRSSVGYGGLVEIRRTLKYIEPPIEDKVRRMQENSPYRSSPDVVEDPMYWLVTRAITDCEMIRSRHPLADLLASADRVLAPARNEIESLPELSGKNKKALNSWARLIAKLADRNVYWVLHIDPSGEDATALQKEAKRRYEKRQDRAENGFLRRYGMKPARFLALSDKQMLGVKIRAGRGAGSDLGIKAERVKQNASKIVARAGGGVEAGDRIEAWAKRIRERLITIPRG